MFLSPIVLQQRQRRPDIRHDEEQTEPVLLPHRPRQFQDVKYRNRPRNHDALSNFQSIHSSEDVDRVGAENGQHAHVNVVEKAHFYGESEPVSKRFGDDDCGGIEIGVVYHQKRQRGDCR